MPKDTLYWLGEGVLEYKKKGATKRSVLVYGDPIPEDALDKKRLTTLMKHGVIGEKPTPVKATETAALKNKIAAQDELIEGLKAGADGNAVGRVAELEEENKNLQATITELETQVSEFETLKETMVKEAQDLQDALGTVDHGNASHQHPHPRRQPRVGLPRLQQFQCLLVVIAFILNHS